MRVVPAKPLLNSSRSNKLVYHFPVNPWALHRKQSCPGSRANLPCHCSVSAKVTTASFSPSTVQTRLVLLGCVLRVLSQEPRPTWTEISRFSLAVEVDSILAATFFESCRRASLAMKPGPGIRA
jgi:hypothetical protein